MVGVGWSPATLRRVSDRHVSDLSDALDFRIFTPVRGYRDGLDLLWRKVGGEGLSNQPHRLRPASDSVGTPEKPNFGKPCAPRTDKLSELFKRQRRFVEYPKVDIDEEVRSRPYQAI